MSAIAFAAHVLPAQGQVMSAGISGAPVAQLGTFDDGRALDTGWHVGIAGRLDLRTRPFGVQVDVGVANSPYEEGTREGHVQSWNAGAGVFYRLAKVTSPVRPYAIVGIGVYYVEEPERVLITPAWNAGAGVEAGTGAIRGFVEARYHYVLTWGRDMQYIPVMLGVRYAFNP
ncbi:MAG: outer membrane beta-barrel protein [Gemmatimonadales bacterium]